MFFTNNNLYPSEPFTKWYSGFNKIPSSYPQTTTEIRCCLVKAEKEYQNKFIQSII